MATWFLHPCTLLDKHTAKLQPYRPPPPRGGYLPILRFLQDCAEYRGYCERICNGDPFSVEDTLALQLERSGPQYADLAGDAIVGLASLSVTLTSRRRLAVNGTVESIGRWLARSMTYHERSGGEGGGGGGAGAGSRGKGWNGGREAVRNAVRLWWHITNAPTTPPSAGCLLHHDRVRVPTWKLFPTFCPYSK